MWRLQQRVRSDDVFRYMSLEVAAYCDRDEQFLSLGPDDLPFGGTTYLQDGALAEIVGEAMRDAGRADDAAEMFETSANFYTYGDQPERALRTRRSASELRPTTDLLLQLAEEQWQASFRAEAHGPDAAEHAVAAGFAALDQLEDSRLDMLPRHFGASAFLRGLLLVRRANLVAAALVDHWLPLPWLLTAAIDDRNQSYRAAHLAWALNDANLNGAGLHFAKRAYSLDSTDTWLQEAMVVMHMNWYGLLDPTTRDLIESINAPAWGASMRALDALHRNDLEHLRSHIDDVRFDDLWAREVHAQAIARVHGIQAAESFYRAAFEEAAARADHLAAADFALVLTDVEGARRHIDQGLRNGTVNPSSGETTLALTDLVSGETEAVDAIANRLRKADRPFVLRELACRCLPVLALAWAETPATVTALTSSQRVAEERLKQLAELPPLTCEIDNGAATSTDNALDGLVRELLLTEEKGNELDDAIAANLRRLAIETAERTSVSASVSEAAARDKTGSPAV